MNDMSICNPENQFDDCPGSGIKKIETVEEYLEEVDKVYKNLWKNEQSDDILKYSPKLWYRGLKDVDYLMLPSIGRKPLSVDYETIYMSKFKSKFIPYLGSLPAYPLSEGLPGYWGWLFLMQHYGVPTRLMDWSEDALVALLFAIDINATPSELEKDPVVWCLNPVKLNEAFTFNNVYPPGYIPNVAENEVYKMFGPDGNSFNNKKPCAVYGPLNTTRIIAQKGVFTIFPYTKDLVEFDKLPDSFCYLEKIIIDKDARKDLTDQLRRYGFNYAQLFPELGFVGMEITEESY